VKKDWEIKKLGDVCEIARGGSPRPIKDYITTDEDGINWIKIGDTDPSGKYIYTTSEKIKPAGLKKSRYVEAGDFLLSNSMSFGRPYVLQTNGCIHDGWLVLKNYQKSLYLDFFYYLLLSPNVQKQFEIEAKGSTVRNLNTEIVSNINVSYPPLEEQKRIVKILDEKFAQLETIKANAQTNLQNAKDLFQSQLTKAFSNTTWEKKKVSEISENLDSKRIPITKNVRKTGQYPYYGASGIVDYVEDYIFDGKFLLVSEDGANLLARTYPIAFIAEGKFWVNNHAHILSFKDEITMKFVELFFSNLDISPYVTGMAQPKFNQASLNNIEVPLPPLPEQKRIVKELDTLSEKVRQLQEIYTKQIANCDELKQSLLQKAFEGEL